MPDSKRFLHPEAIRRIARLDLRARHIVEGFLSGMHRSPYFGQSVEFLQHREYVPGDDLRHVDWKVWARQDRLVVKQFEEDTNLRCTMVVDVSHSMQYGNGPLNKFEYAATIAASLSYLVLQQQDAVGCITFDEKIRMRVPIRSKRNHIHSVIDSLDTQSPSDKTDMYAVMREIAETVPRRGMIMLVSDLLGDIEGTIKGLKLLRQRGHDILVFHVLDDDELDFEFNGAMRFDGLESDDFINCNPRALREGYLAAINEFLTDVRRQCASNAVDYALIRTSDPLDAVLAKYLSRRLGHRRS
ncbi:MAG: DUF58 domain-containing protein [Planctomycetaceae bacterium]|jgi:uncharacterized protein (DUF58 family)|nr:DUF58 domain-containing protein [Planctomycetaceae bacterium]MBT4723667.1 DUF58 domain-containing protein [Planctomycetaceae bacterium]MBT4846804.1 DUF58 domain-containing protein [Planctomycetaceae bacterium]MBT5124802.1 DUF58 domain-containing protein [Planctomycetaceae bacterium]MBT5883716.1 DUF58 domain-containing protein [Planctomycetaceae bacterium]